MKDLLGFNKILVAYATIWIQKISNKGKIVAG